MPATLRAFPLAFFASTRPATVLGAAIIASALAAQIVSHQKPWAPFAPVELSNQLVAAMGFAWAAIQLKTLWRDPAARRAWAAACLGMALIALEDNVDRFLPMHGHPVAEIAVTIGLWLAAAGLIFSCGRLYGMRRSVESSMRFALVVQTAVHGLVLVAALTASWRVRQHAALVDTVAETGELASALSYVFALLMTAFAPMKSYRFPLSRLGRKARAIFRDFRLERAARYPTPYPALRRPVAREVVTLAMAMWFTPRSAASARTDGGGSTLRQCFEIARLAVRRGVDPLTYYQLGLYRHGGEEAGDAALTRLETKNGLTLAIQGLKQRSTAPSEMSDKLEFWRICERHGVASAPILALAEGGACERFAGEEAFDRNLFVKERRGRGGKFTLNYVRIAPLLYRDDSGEIVSLDAVCDRLADFSAERRLILQPKLANHAAVASFARDSLVVFRVVTCLDERDEPRVTHGVMRLLRRFEPTWPEEPEHEWGAAIDLEAGALGPLTGDVAETCGRWSDLHPVTGELVRGRRLDCWPAVAAIAVKAHRVFASRVFIGWDIAATPDGPAILEGNANMDFCFIQRCYRTPVGLSPLGPLLDGRLDSLVAARLAAARTPGVFAAPAFDR